MNLQYEIRICHKIHNKGTMSQWQIKVTIFLSRTDVNSCNCSFLELEIEPKCRKLYYKRNRAEMQFTGGKIPSICSSKAYIEDDVLVMRN